MVHTLSGHTADLPCGLTAYPSDTNKTGYGQIYIFESAEATKLLENHSD
jgi:hypothetical protein